MPPEEAIARVDYVELSVPPGNEVAVWTKA